MSTLTPTSIETLKTLATLTGLKTASQADAFGLTPLEFGNVMKRFLKAGLVERTTRVCGGNTYQLTAEGRKQLPKPEPVPLATAKPKAAKAHAPGKFLCVTLSVLDSGLLAVCPVSAAWAEELGSREVKREEIRPLLTAGARAKFEKLTVGMAMGVEIAPDFFGVSA